MASVKRKEYTTDVDLYEKGKVEYTRESVEFLLSKVGALEPIKPITILELGAGTGKFTRVMVEVLGDNTDNTSTVRIIPSDPMPSMREKFKKMLPGVEIKQFTAEKIELPHESIDIVISAQGFHWYGNQKSVSEIHRVLVPGGKFGLIWNSKDVREPWVAKIEAVFEPVFKRDLKPDHLDKEWKGHIDSSKYFSEVEGKEDFRNYQEGDMDSILQSLLCSSSFVQSSGSEKKEMESKTRNILTSLGTTYFKLPFVSYVYWCTKTDL